MLYELSLAPRVVLLDAKCAELVDLKGYEELWPGWDKAGGGCGSGWTDLSVVDFFRKQIECGSYAPRFRVVIHTRSFFAEQFEAVSALLRHVKSCVLAVDELSLFLPAGSSRLSPAVQSVLVSGRHDGIEFIGTAQRPSLVHPTARALAARMLVFRVTEQNCLDALRPYFCPELFASVSSLPDQVAVDWRDGEDAFVDWTFRGKLSGILPG